MPFPGIVNVQPAPGVAGDFCDVNPRFTVPTGAGALVAGANGVTIGAFCWADPTFTFVSSSGGGPVTGFVGRAGLRADIVTFLADSGMVIQSGQEVTVYNGGDFWVKNSGSSATVVGQKAYANSQGGLATFAATGTPPAAASVTGTVAQNVGTATIIANSFTASISGTTMTVSAVAAGGIVAGQFLTGTGIDPATSVVSQLSGTTGGVGTYQVSISQTVTSTTIGTSGAALNLTALTTGYFTAGAVLSGTGVTTGQTILAQINGTAGGVGLYQISIAQTNTSQTVTDNTYSTMNVTAVGSGTLGLGDTISGAGVTAGSYINAFITGTGGTGTYQVTNKQTVGSTTITVAAGVETRWYAMSVAAPGELVRISDHPLG
jgi:hypothetical protein